MKIKKKDCDGGSQQAVGNSQGTDINNVAVLVKNR